MANLKIVSSTPLPEEKAVKNESIVFNPVTGDSPVEKQQNSSMFLSSDESSVPELGGGGEFLIFKRRSTEE